MIIVTGATGHLGHQIVQNLIKRVSPVEVGASVRDPQKATDLAALGVRVRQGNFDDPVSLTHAFEGASQVLIVSSNARATGGDPLKQHRNAIDASISVGARRIVYTSHMAVSASSAFPPMLDHHATENMLRESGSQWTALRNGFYAASGIMLLGDASKTGIIDAPADGKISWTAHADLAEAAAIILANEGQFEGPTPPLTASEALDLADMANILPDILHKPVQRNTIDDDAMRDKILARGIPPSAVKIMLGLYAASRAGEFAKTDATLATLLGRSPISFRTLLAEKFSASGTPT
jgi:NAD(P)H dehydrogenase (quinone)